MRLVVHGNGRPHQQRVSKSLTSRRSTVLVTIAIASYMYSVTIEIPMNRYKSRSSNATPKKLSLRFVSPARAVYP